MNGVLCSQREAHPWWELLKTIAGIEAHELNSQTWTCTTPACWVGAYCKLQRPQLADWGDQRQAAGKSLTIPGFTSYLYMLQIQTFRYLLMFHRLKHQADASRKLINTCQQSCNNYVPLYQSINILRVVKAFLAFSSFAGLNIAIISPKNRCCGPSTVQTVHYEVTKRAVTGILHELYNCICAYLPLFACWLSIDWFLTKYLLIHLFLLKYWKILKCRYQLVLLVLPC